MPKKKESFSEIENFNVENLIVMNGYVVVKPDAQSEGSFYGEVVSFGSINPLRLSIGEKVYFDHSKATKISKDLYALKFDDIIARNAPQNSPAKTLLVEESAEEELIQEEEEQLSSIIVEIPTPVVETPVANNPPINPQVPAVNPPSYNVTKSYQPKKTPAPTGVKHVDKPIRK